MSYIDTFDHEFMGLFGGIPVYHPLVTVKGSFEGRDFGCTPKNLVIGGGSGEHPPIILLRPDSAVGFFISDWMIRSSSDDDKQMNGVRAKIKAAGSSYGVWKRFLDRVCAQPEKTYLRFADWNASDFHEFYTLCASTALQTPYVKSRDGDFGRWLAACLGELLFFSMPDLIPDVEKKLPGVYTCIQRPTLLNVLVPAPGYPPLYGRIVKNKKVIWGHSRWWKKR